MKLRHTPLSIPAHGDWLTGMLAHAPDVRALALCIHSSGRSLEQSPLDGASGPLEPALQAAGFATMTVELLTSDEALHDADAAFNIPRLTERILAAVDWAIHQPSLDRLPLGLVADGTGCAAAIRAAVNAPESFTSIACLGGRPDLAGAAPLRAVRTPARFVVVPESPDAPMLASAYALLQGERDWLALPAAGEHDRQRHAAQAASDWLASHLPPVDETGTGQPPRSA
ncbi:alpha/beta hydrolase [Thauera sp. SDU_THAU2]|uniref:alpha/beta hydrolase n=1 Tax=Thauera sp. SDU_THAU2 TaxID=3136633 RepID=UPI00311DF8F5